MRTLRIGTAIGTIALLALAGSAAAQTRPSAVLNSLELRQLASRAEPGDHARLGTHFAALSDEYAREAAWHTAMSRALAGNPNHQPLGAIAYYTHLAALKNESAVITGDLAIHHERLAAGVLSSAPRESSRFENGDGAPPPTDRELAALSAAARTPTDHRALQEYFLTQAVRHETAAAGHATMAAGYRGNPRGGLDPAMHCDRMAKLSREAAAEARAAAAQHEQWATIG